MEVENAAACTKEHKDKVVLSVTLTNVQASAVTFENASQWPIPDTKMMFCFATVTFYTYAYHHVPSDLLEPYYYIMY